jgi:hypothetical protein
MYVKSVEEGALVELFALFDERENFASSQARQTT